MCGYCEELQSAVEEMRIHIHDLWADSSLGVGQATEYDPGEAFSYRQLMGYDVVRRTFPGFAGV